MPCAKDPRDSRCLVLAVVAVPESLLEGELTSVVGEQEHDA
jgi:hypothetical protein